VDVAKTVEQLRQSPYHQELARKMCAAFVAQQQGITLNTAMKKVPDPVGDLWLVIADVAERAVSEAIDIQFPSDGTAQSTGLLMWAAASNGITDDHAASNGGGGFELAGSLAVMGSGSCNWAATSEPAAHQIGEVATIRW
jgi:ribulose kinase